MKRISLAAALLALTTLAAHAQVGVYGKLDYNHYDHGDASSLYGASLGLYDDFLHAGPIAVGGDVRAGFQSGDSYHYRSLLLGARLALKVPAVPLKPYIEPLFGYGGARYAASTNLFPNGTNYDNKLLYGIGGGLDLTVLPHIDWRVIEIDSLREKNGTLPNPSFLVSTGAVVRF